VSGLVLAAAVMAGAIVAASLRPALEGSDLVPAATSEALAWGAGGLVAYGAALRAAPRGGGDGIVLLAPFRGVLLSRYLRARVAGLGVVLAIAVSGATLLVGLAATATSHHPGLTARLVAGSVVFGLAFALTMAPLAMAAMWGRSRAAGYLIL